MTSTQLIKRLFLISLVVGGLLFVAFGQSNPQPQPEPVTLQWDYPSNEIAGITFRIYHSTDATAPLSQWQLLATVPETNRVSIEVIPGAHFFVGTASNFWGESVFSNTAYTPDVPRAGVNFRIRRGL